MGDNTSCQVRGIGDIQLKMFDGVTRLLQKVRYLLYLRRNLISLGQLDSMRYTYKEEGGKIKITKGALVVIKAAIRDGLYEMIGETDIKDQATSLMAEINKTVLWHNRLGHRAKRGCKFSVRMVYLMVTR